MRLKSVAQVAFVVILAAAAWLAGGCATREVRTPTVALAVGGDQARGREAIVVHGCGACHRIPGVADTGSLVGPPLDGWSQRSFIAGTLPNSAENLRRWLRDPQGVRPGSAMPDLGLTDSEVADIVAYLFTIG